MEWLNKRPEEVVDQAEPADLLADARVRPLSDSALGTLDHVLRQWTLRALVRAADTEGLLTLDDLAALGLKALPGGAEGERLRTRWQVFRDLLESKRLAIHGRESGRARQLLHSGRIVELLATGPQRQSELQAALDLSPQRLSQVLAVMEEGGLVRRERQGKEKIVSLAAEEASRSDRKSAQRSVGATVWGNRPGRVA